MGRVEKPAVMEPLADPSALPPPPAMMSASAMPLAQQCAEWAEEEKFVAERRARLMQSLGANGSRAR